MKRIPKRIVCVRRPAVGYSVQPAVSFSRSTCSVISFWGRIGCVVCVDSDKHRLPLQRNVRGQ